ncbi:MAG: hypothetical protein IPI81_02610 [Flavobacteriales bacterium]|nr:hypothetical protein [Flavobacteriales bacterium]
MSWLRSTPPGLLLAVLITLLRLLVIDIDPPVRDLTDYLPKDEGFYVFPAYDLYERGDAFVDHPFRITGIPTITNVGTYLGLVAFGDNYMGLRMGSVLFALVALLCFHALLSRITTDRILLNVLPLIMVSDLSFGFASIMVEPTMRAHDHDADHHALAVPDLGKGAQRTQSLSAWSRKRASRPSHLPDECVHTTCVLVGDRVDHAPDR